MYTKPSIITDCNKTFKYLDRLFMFNVRHILVHEIPSTWPYAVQDIGDFLNASSEFAAACDEVLAFELWGPVPYTQLEMTIAAHKELEHEETALAETLAKVRLLDAVDPLLLDDAQDAWEKFSRTEAALYSSLARGSSSETMEYSLAKAKLVRNRRTQLSWWLEREERRPAAP